MTKPEFWKNRRVLLTGHSGFKGSWLSIWLSALGAKVVGVSLPPSTQPNLFSLAGIEDLITSYFLDIRDAGALCKLTQKHEPEIIFHLAAQALVRPSYEDPAGTFATNVMGTVNAIEAARATSSVKMFLNVTSDKCYRLESKQKAYAEGDPLGGHDPYSASKACSEIVSDAYRLSFPNSLPIATARAGNVIGGGDWSRDRLLPDCIRASLKGESIDVRNPEAVRPWQHVLEPLGAYLHLAEATFNEPGFAKAYNFGPEASDQISVLKMVELFCKAWGSPARFQLRPDGGAHEAPYLMLSTEKAQSELGWEARWKVERAIQEVVLWSKALAAGRSARNLCLETIERFTAEGNAK